MSMIMASMAGQKRVTPTPPPAFNPLTDISWYALYNAVDCAGVGDGNEITTWTDASGNSRHLTGATSKKPTYTASATGLNSKPAVTNVSTDYLASASGVFGTLAAPLSVFVVGRIGTRNSGTNQMILASTTTTTRQFILRAGSNNTWQLVTNANLSTGGTPDTTKHMFAGYGNNASSKFQVDNSYTTGSTGANTQGFEGLTVGARNDGALTSQLEVAFIGIYSGDIFSHAKWADLKAWVTSEYGVST